MIVAAFDLSLTNTGFAIATGGSVDRRGTIPGKGAGIPRMLQMREDVMRQVEAVKPAFVIMEDLAFSMNKSYAKENAGNAYLIRAELFQDNIPMVLVASTSLKKFVTGKGSAPKELVMKEVLRRWGIDTQSTDEADAIGLAYIGMTLAGDWEPTMDAQREVLATIRKSSEWLPQPLDCKPKSK